MFLESAVVVDVVDARACVCVRVLKPKMHEVLLGCCAMKVCQGCVCLLATAAWVE